MRSGNQWRAIEFSEDDTIFFHSVDGAVICDEEGIELADNDEALARATHEVRILAAEKILSDGKLVMHERIEITDAAGRNVGRITVQDVVTIED